MTTLNLTVSKLARPIHMGDWHDKPMRWEVRSGSERQVFPTKAEAIRFAGIWLREGCLMKAINNSFRY